MRAEWRKAPAFAEIAEALHVRTDQIMAAMNVEGEDQRWFALATLDDENKELIYAIKLERDADGVLVQFGKPEAKPGMWETIKQRMEDS